MAEAKRIWHTKRVDRCLRTNTPLFRMYLKKVEISGFKSFANRTVLDFIPEGSSGPLSGITAIVGPNGSGKSNVADAIRWAIGEQSSKNLRGKKAEDVIFAGTDKKTKLGAASVTLYFDNTDHRIPVEFSEVSIMRKVYRSGEGEYLINGSRVRLMDVVDLLAKAGIGKDSYSVITQGMSDALLRASNTERRSMLEDAAGVKQYQIEKERAKRRLESTEENLRQADLLLAELAPHLKNLRRQAEKMSASQEIALALKTKQEALYGFLWQTFQGERGTVALQKDTHERELFDMEIAAKKYESEVRALSEKMIAVTQEEELQKSIQQAQLQVNETAQKIALLEGKITLEREKQKVEEVVRVIPVDLTYVEGALTEVEGELSGLMKELSGISSLQELGAFRDRIQRVHEKLVTLRTKAGAGTTEEKTVISLPEAEQRASEERVVAYESEIETLKAQAETFFEQLSGLQKELETYRQETKENREAFFAAERLWREQEAALMQKKDIVNDLRVRLARVEVREEDLVNLVQEELHIRPEVLPEVTESVEKEKLEREIARLKVDIEHIGTLDPLVVEEFNETEERVRFLQQESDDLRAAIVSLEAVVKEMDVKIEAAFQDAYTDIRKKFKEYFELIFGGGKADMTLERIAKRRVAGDEEIEGEDPQEAVEVGIEITACPPGKKITSLTMLSGGERSLTSLALLFAIIAYNPPPFAVLDEVEAALDEANSRRFGNMLGELSKHTQFVAITHNRETMRQANLIYGVTMGGDGISQLLSIKLDQALEQK